MGSETKLTEEVIKNITTLIKERVPIAYACIGAGIGRTTYYDYINRGENDRQDGKETIFVHFLESLERADAELMKECLASARAKAKERGSWEEEWRFMECRWRPEFGREVVVRQGEEAWQKRERRYYDLYNKPAEVVDGEIREMKDGEQVTSAQTEHLKKDYPLLSLESTDNP